MCGRGWESFSCRCELGAMPKVRAFSGGNQNSVRPGASCGPTGKWALKCPRQPDALQGPGVRRGDESGVRRGDESEVSRGNGSQPEVAEADAIRNRRPTRADAKSGTETGAEPTTWNWALRTGEALRRSHKRFGLSLVRYTLRSPAKPLLRPFKTCETFCDANSFLLAEHGLLSGPDSDCRTGAAGRCR